MDDGLKQRIIGAFFLIALVVIFVPIMFHEDRIVPLDRTTRIPSQPEIDPIEIKSPESSPLDTGEEILQAKDVFVPDETRPQTLVEEKPHKNDKGMPLSWTLQIASFSEAKRAVELRDKLIEDGYNGYIKEVTTNKGDRVRVYVGPKLSKNSLIAQKKEIDEKYQLTAIILRFSS